MAEALFKSFGKALDMATMEEPRIKGCLDNERKLISMSYKKIDPLYLHCGGQSSKMVYRPGGALRGRGGAGKTLQRRTARTSFWSSTLSDSDDEHEEAIDLMRRINRVIRIPMVAGGNIRRQEDVKKILYAGAKRAMLNFSKPESVKMIEDAAKRFGKEKIAVSLNDFDALVQTSAHHRGLSPAKLFSCTVWT